MRDDGKAKLPSGEAEDRPAPPVAAGRDADSVPAHAQDRDTEHALEAIDTHPDRKGPPAAAPRPLRSRFPSIAGYEIEEVIGRGGMGVVYRARDLKLGRTVAIKTLPLAHQNKDAGKRFENEARLLAQVQHSGVVQIFEFGFADDPESRDPLPFIVMEFVDGPNLDHFNNGNPLKPAQAAALVHELARILSACHKQGIIHRDLKPGNVLMASDVEPKLTDFGLARIRESDVRMTRSGEVMGTPGFMAPEQASGAVKNPGPGVDVYGLGAILYALLTGRPPFMAPDPMQTMIQVLTQPPIAPSALQAKLPRDLETITLKCLEKKPRHRYESCDDLAGDLRAFLSNKPISAKRTPALRKAALWVRRHPAWSSLVAVVIAGSLAAILGTAFHVNRLQSELDRSQRIINESRAFSKWLLDDFREILESRGGVTYTRGELAGRTQTYLDALLVEATNDPELKTDLAYAFLRLADIQGQTGAGSLGQTGLARENLDKAEQLVLSLEDKSTELAQKVMASIELQRAAALIEAGKIDLAQQLLGDVENRTGEASPFKKIDRLAMESQIALNRFQIALAAGDQNAAATAMAKIDQLADQIVADGCRPEMSIITWVTRAHVAEQFLEPQHRFAELLETLDESEKSLIEIGKQYPLIDLDTSLCTIDTKLGNACYYTQEFEKALVHYQSALERNVRIYQRDSRNHVACFNTALSWQFIGETQVAMEQFDEAQSAYEAAVPFFEQWIHQTGGQLDQQLPWLGFLARQAELDQRMGKLEQAREIMDRQIRALQALGDNTPILRRTLGDSLLVRAFIEAETMNTVVDADEATFLDACRKTLTAFEAAGAQFEAMDRDGIGSEATRAQANTAASMVELVKTQIQQIEGIPPADDF
jgi:serine/threonine protein kinase